jgi:CBS domain-containing protein
MNACSAVERRTVGAHETLQAAARRMAEGDLTCLVALDQGTPRGVVTDRDLVLAALCDGLGAEAPLTALAWRPLVSVVQGESADEALRLMERNGLRHLPVTEGEGRIVGMVAIEDALAILLQDLTELAQRARVGSMLRRPGNLLRAADTQVALPALEGGESARALAARMKLAGTEALLVLEGTRPAGIVTERDLLPIVEGRQDPERTRARDLVGRPFVSVRPGDPLEAVVDRMTRHGVEWVAVVRQRRALGVVSLRGLLAGLAFEFAELVAQAARETREATARSGSLPH